MMRTSLVLALVAATAALVTPARAQSNDPARYLDQYVDSSANPRDDFFRFAVGKWLKDHPIPANESAWGIYNVVQEETYQRLQGLNQQAAAAAPAPGSNAQKIGDFWRAAMDSDAAARQGIAPLQPEFDRIAAIHDLAGLIDAVARLQYIGVDALCGLYIFQDERHSDRNVLYLYQAGLGLPDRDYYFDSDERTTNIRKEYVTHVARMFGLLGDDTARAQVEARTVMAVETELAGASRKLEALRDPEANYNPMSVAGMATLTPTIRWQEFLAQGRIDGLDSVVVGQPEFFRQVEKSLNGHSLDEWKAYLRWRLVDAFASQAGGAFDAEHFHFFGTVLNGTPEQRPRWKRVLDMEERYLGDALGQLYVERYVPARTKARYEKLVDDIFDAFRARIRALPWMSAATKTRALHKLDLVTKKVAFPAKWRDYASYRVVGDSFLIDCERGNVWSREYDIAKLHKPVDRTEWDMTPQTYNAYYNPSNNEIVLPAAAFILPGIADSLVDDALIYSYAGGSTIGHEITHGFDDEGRKFDERGNLVDWWTAADTTAFKARAERIVRQYADYVAVDSLHVNGQATEGENIADLGGIQLSWDAFMKTDEYRRGASIGGYTPAQRFFIGWALAWMSQIRPENLAVRVKTDVHAPDFLRVNGPVSNLPPFYAAFGVKPGDRMYRADSVRVQIW